jgi:hypothetical protein
LGKVQGASPELGRLRDTESKLRAAGKSYWADQVSIQALEVEAWITAAQGRSHFKEAIGQSSRL